MMLCANFKEQMAIQSTHSWIQVEVDQHALSLLLESEQSD